MNTVSVNYKGLNPGSARPVVDVPLSKSMAARALILNYIRGVEENPDLPQCSDTQELSAAISRLKTYIPNLPDYMSQWQYYKNKVKPSVYIKEGFDMGSGGTSLRFFLALVASIPGLKVKLRCSEQLKRRPLMPLIKVLRELGAKIDCEEKEGYAPLVVTGGILTGGVAKLPDNISSQYLSALILVDSLWDKPLQYEYDSKVQVSVPYIMMTGFMASQKGCAIIEGDWSSAAFFYEIALLAEGVAIEIHGLERPGVSVQGDSRCAEIFGELGVKSEFPGNGKVLISGDHKKIAGIRASGKIIKFDMSQTPDLVPPLVIGMTLAGICFELENVGTLRYKESDRLLALTTELCKLGFNLKVEGDSLKYNGDRIIAKDAELCSWNDHRMAMGLACASVKIKGIEVDGECVAKSFPQFFEQIAKLGFEVMDKRDI